MSLVRYVQGESTQCADPSSTQDAAGETVVHAAAVSGHVEILRLYLEQYPFTVDWVNSRSLTPLHLAAMKGQAEAVQVCRLFLVLPPSTRLTGLHTAPRRERCRH